MLIYSGKDGKKLREIGSKLKEDSTGALLDEHQNRFEIKQKLGGRGQAGLANFYSPDGGKTQYLIKQDDAATCVLEGTAYFLRDTRILPPSLSGAVNYAKLGSLISNNDETLIVSIQDRVMPDVIGGKIQPWDELVFGAKRNPHTWVSQEALHTFWNKKGIKTPVYSLSSSAQWDLAAGILASAIVGDESLHVGQFMAKLDTEGTITGITRIDLGARERFAVSRSENKNLDPFHASPEYQSKGQFNKDYVSFLLEEPTLRQKYSQLWARLHANKDAVANNVYEKSRQAIIEQFQILPNDKIKKEALENILKAINKAGKTSVNDPVKVDPEAPVDKQIETLANVMAKLDAERTHAMIVAGYKEFTTQLDADKQKALELRLEEEGRNLLGAVRQFRQDLILGNGKNEEQILGELYNHLKKQIALSLQKFEKNPSNSLYPQQIQFMAEQALNLIESYKLHEMDKNNPNRNVIKKLEERVDRFKTMHDVAKYCVRTEDKAKQAHSRGIIGAALTMERQDFRKWLEDEEKRLIQVLGAHSGLGGYMGKPTHGLQLLQNLYAHYNLPSASLVMNKTQIELLEASVSKDFSKVFHITQSQNFTVDDALVRDRYGRTVLHYLMDHGSGNEASAAIVNILKNSFGNLSNTNLNIQDNNGDTPAHLLMGNPNSQEIVSNIDKAKLKATTFGGSYKFNDFFKMDSPNKAGLTPKDILDRQSIEAQPNKNRPYK
ncbi:MAG TPA: hypothetical protein VFP93_01880 [Gammaproteobacteria bacterium]|nr:hypothetical protein [Gammaproteobacteria bacterium]